MRPGLRVEWVDECEVPKPPLVVCVCVLCVCVSMHVSFMCVLMLRCILGGVHAASNAVYHPSVCSDADLHPLTHTNMASRCVLHALTW